MKKWFFMIALAILMVAQANTTNAFCTDNVPSQYEDAAKALYNEGVLKGNPDGSCSLTKRINRIEFAVMAMRKSVGDDDAKKYAFKTGVFKDLSKGDSWYARYAITAHKMGILKGDGQGRLRATDGVNAAEAMVIAARAAELEMPTPGSGEDWFMPTLNVLKQSGVKVFDPSYRMNRGDVVVLLNQIDQYNTDIWNNIDDYNPAKAATKASEATPKGYGDIAKLIMEFEALESSEANKIYNRMTSDEKRDIEAFGPNFSLLLLAGLCEANTSRTMSTAAGDMNCNQANSIIAQLQTDSNGMVNFQKNLETEMTTLLIREACVSKNYNGEINKETCKTFLANGKSYSDQYFKNKNISSQPTVDYSKGSNDEYYLGVKKPKTAEEKEVFNDFIDIMGNMQAGSRNTMSSIINNFNAGSCYRGDSDCY